jgi:hypothetical protein
LQLSPHSQFSHPQFSQVQFSQFSPSQSHVSHVQLSPQQQLLADESAAKLLNPRTDAPATTAVANNFEVTDMINLLRAIARVIVELEDEQVSTKEQASHSLTDSLTNLLTTSLIQPHAIERMQA